MRTAAEGSDADHRLQEDTAEEVILMFLEGEAESDTVIEEDTAIVEVEVDMAEEGIEGDTMVEVLAAEEGGTDLDHRYEADRQVEEDEVQITVDDNLVHTLVLDHVHVLIRHTRDPALRLRRDVLLEVGHRYRGTGVAVR